MQNFSAFFNVFLLVPKFLFLTGGLKTQLIPCILVFSLHFFIIIHMTASRPTLAH